MALKDLKSDLSWYGKKSPGPYTPPAKSTDTKFTNHNDVPGVSVTGYSKTDLSTVGYRQVTAGDSFSINPLDSTKGLSSRKAQGGAGFPFLNDTGFSNIARYGDAVTRLDVKDGKAKLAAGTAWRYTANSPIDDMYNKFKVRDEAYNPIGYAKEPFILRGLQENDRTKPRRWGFGLNFDDGLIRGGIVTAAERLAIDTLRIGKWLIKPKGLLWMAKQFGLQQSNPTFESALTGTPGLPLAQPHKIFTPINLLANTAGNALGLHFQRHGVLPVPTAGRYEGIHKKRNALGAITAKFSNRLNAIGREMFSTPLSFVGGKVAARTAANGPNTLYGIPGTSTLAFPIRYENTRKGFTDAQRSAKGLNRPRNHYFSTAAPSLTENLSPTNRIDIGRVLNPTLEQLDTNPFTRFGTGRYMLRKEWQNATVRGRDYNRFVVTGLDAQLSHQGGAIKGYGAKVKITGRLNTQNDPYFGNAGISNTSIQKNHKGSNQTEREDNLRSGKKAGKKLKDQQNYYSKGLLNPDGSIAIGGESRVDNAPAPANTSDQTAAGNNIKPVQHYAAMSYGKITEAAKASSTAETSLQDFRKVVLEDSSKSKNWIGKVYDEKGKESTYEKESLEAKYNFPAVGKGGRDRSNRLANNMPDPINASPWELGNPNPDPELKDFINFKFYPIGMGKKLSSAKDPILFRAFIDSISDNITPQWSENNDQGRADAKIMLESWSREISLSFKVAAFSANELQHLYNKMEALALIAYPDYTASNGFVGRYVKIWIGDLYKNEPCYITSLSFDWDNETPWELDNGLQVPHYTTVNMNLGWIGNMRPDASKTKVFSVNSKDASSKYKTANNATTEPLTYNIAE